MGSGSRGVWLVWHAVSGGAVHENACADDMHACADEGGGRGGEGWRVLCGSGDADADADG